MKARRLKALTCQLAFFKIIYKYIYIYMARKTPESEGGPELISPLLDKIIETIKNAPDDVARVAAVDKASKSLHAVTKDQVNIEIDQSQHTTQNLEATNEWVGKNSEFVGKNVYKHLANASKELDASKALLQATFAKGNPTWLASGAGEIQHCAQAAEFVSRIALLPESLRNNPDVLYKETMRYSASVPWGTMSVDAEKEANMILDRAMKKIRLQRNEGSISSEQGVAERMLQSLTKSSIDTGKTPVFYIGDPQVRDLTRPTGKLVHGSPEMEEIGKKLDAELRELQKQIQDDDALLHDSTQLSKTIQRLKDNFGQDNVSLYVAKLRHMTHTETTVRNTARTAEREKYWTNLGLHEADMAPTWVSKEEARWQIETLLQDIETTSTKYPNGMVIESLENRTRNLMGYFASADYKEHLIEYAQQKFGVDHPELVNAHVNELLQQIPDLQEKIKNRMGALITYGHIKLGGEPKKVSESLLNLGTKGLNYCLSENNGITERVYNRYISLMKLGRYDPVTHREVPYTTETLYQLRERVRNELLHDQGLYEQPYKNCWGETHEFDKKAVDAIIRQAEVAVAITQQDLVALRDAPGPARREARPGDILASSSFLSMSTAERFLAAMDLDSYAFEKWGKLTEYPQYVWRRMCELAGKGSDRHKTSVARMLEGVVQGDPKFLELAERAFGSEGKMTTLLTLEKKANPLKHIGKVPKSFSELSMKDLKSELIIQEGKKIVTEILEAYDDLSSGWRIKQYLIQLNRMYGVNAPALPGHELEEQYLYGPHHLGLGMQLRLAGYDLIHAESEATQHKAGEKVKRVLRDEIALYRPQATFEFLETNADTDAKNLFDGMVSHGKLKGTRLGGEDITHVDQFYHYISRNFVSINDSLADVGLGPINYSVDPTKDQMEIVKKVCGVTGYNAEAYLETMKELSVFAQKEQNITKLVQTDYYHIYHRTKWVDDLRNRYLENPDTAPGSRTKAEHDEKGTVHIKLSETFVEDGTGGGDQLPRAWGDLGVALESLDALTAAIKTNDKKEFFKQVKLVFEGVGRYSGYKPAAARAAIYMLGGFGESAATDEMLNVIMVNALENTSPMKRLIGDKGISNSPGQNLELTEEFEGLLMGKLHDLAPHLAEEAEKFIGIRWGWVPDKMGEIGHHLPAWADRAKIAIILAGLLIVAQGIKTVGEESSGKKK